MGDYPKTMQKFQDWFSSEESCRQYLFRLRWPKGFQCPRCGNEKAWAMSRDLYRCTGGGLQCSVTCGYDFSGYPQAFTSLVPSNVVLNGYRGLEPLGYDHQVIEKEAHIGENLLPLANRVASLPKRWLVGTHQGAVRPSNLDYYLDEFTFRFNRRTSLSRGMLFYRLVQQAVAIEPVPAKNIKGICIRS